MTRQKWCIVQHSDGNVRVDRMLEFVSEIFREYWVDPKKLSKDYPDYFALIEEAVI